MTHKEKILKLFRENEGKEINHRRIIDSEPAGLGISEYSGRITDLREDFGCTCSESQFGCTAKEHIVNTKKNYYRYESSLPQRKPNFEAFHMPQKNDLPDDLHQLRVMWTKAQKCGDQILMRRITAKEYGMDDELTKSVRDALL